MTGILCLSISFATKSKNGIAQAATIPVCPQVIATGNLSDPESVAVSTYTLSQSSSTSINRDTVNVEKYNMTLSASNEVQYSNTYLNSSGTYSYVWSGIEKVTSGNGAWTGSYNITASHITSVNISTVKGWLGSDPNCTINGVNIGINDFIVSKWSGYILFCGHAASTPVLFNTKINGVPAGFNGGGAWWYIDGPITSSADLNNASKWAQKGSYNFAYNRTTPSTFQNGNTNNIHAYYVEPNYGLTTSAALGTSNPLAVGGSTTFSLSAGYNNKRNIANNFNENISDEFELKHKVGSNYTSYYRTIGSTVKGIPLDNTLSLTSSAVTWSGSGTIGVPATFTDNSGATIVLQTGDLYCMNVRAVPGSGYPYQAANSFAQACVSVTAPPAPVISCSDNYLESNVVIIPYTISNNLSSSITVDGSSNNYSVTGTIGVYSPGYITYPGVISSGQSGSGQIGLAAGTLSLGKYIVNLTLKGPNGFSASTSCNLYIVIKPFFKVYGSGVMTGSDFGQSCTLNSNADIASFNPGSNPLGSATDQALFATGYQYGFGSSNNNYGVPNMLSFANNDTSITLNNSIGGNFGGVFCMPDYFTLFTNAYNSGVNTISTQSTNNISAFPTTNNSQNVLLFSGSDVNITGNIILPSTFSNGVIPYLYIVVQGGNIYINNNVTEVDAILISQPDNNQTGGGVYTCSSTFILDSTNFSSNGCVNKLTVKGALLANSVYLYRSSNVNTRSVGYLNSATGNGLNGCNSDSGLESEQICYSPIYWLTNPFTNNGVNSNIDYLKTLPPTL